MNTCDAAKYSLGDLKSTNSSLSTILFCSILLCYFALLCQIVAPPSIQHPKYTFLLAALFFTTKFTCMAWSKSILLTSKLKLLVQIKFFQNWIKNTEDIRQINKTMYNTGNTWKNENEKSLIWSFRLALHPRLVHFVDFNSFIHRLSRNKLVSKHIYEKGLQARYWVSNTLSNKSSSVWTTSEKMTRIKKLAILTKLNNQRFHGIGTDQWSLHYGLKQDHFQCTKLSPIWALIIFLWIKDH